MKRKIIAPILAFGSVFLAVLVSLGTYFINQIGWPFAWLSYEWRDPSYVEMINYRGIWADFFFWLVVILGLLAFIRKLRKLSFSMKKVVFFTVVLVILAFDWAALHDIGAGEPNPYQEYAVLILTPFLFLLMGFVYRKKLLN